MYSQCHYGLLSEDGGKSSHFIHSVQKFKAPSDFTGNITALLCSIRRDREERLAALSAAQQEAMEELQKKIQMKVSLYASTSLL